MKTTIIKSILLLLVMFTFSCEDVLVNEDPNGVVINDLPPEVIMPGAQTVPAATFISRMNGLGNLMTATWSGNAQQVQAPYFTEFQYQLTTDFYDDIWDNLMARTGNLTQIINNDNAGNYDYFKGASLILRAFYFQYLVDLYGDIPFTEIHQRGNNLFPSYDSQEMVYMNLITQINDAIDMISNTDANSAIDMGSNDVMMNGDMDKWIRFANTIKLRMIVRIYDYAQTNSEASTFVNAEIATLNQPGTAFITSGDDVIINPGYADTNNQMSPFPSTYGYAAGEFGNSGNVTFGNLATGPTIFLVELLDGTTTSVSDSRLNRLYALRGGQSSIQGNTQGGGGQPSRLGPGLLSSPLQDGYIMTASEALFLQSEAVFKGILNSGDAKGLFQEAISSSFARLGANIGNYLTESDNVDGIGWEGTADKLEAIITQKWIDLGGTNGIETWIEFTRTGYPSDMPLPDITNRPNRPIRLLYPTSEYAGNTANVSPFNQTVDTAFETSIFWDVD
ncbi:SusD/RagB family nutrient-binding outer membrane lipoprotein [Winogradskyella ouciana]|uniref:SusD/RagB family nutrient-binding outer membrane lipoprotein n=1 Tax=Winogradskyella ouciana TaxID=2608631 RepID=UPI003D296A21